MMTTKRIKKSLVAIIIWQATILIFTLFAMAVSYEPLDFLLTYLSVMWILTLIIVLFGAIIAGILYLIDD